MEEPTPEKVEYYDWDRGTLVRVRVFKATHPDDIVIKIDRWDRNAKEWGVGPTGPTMYDVMYESKPIDEEMALRWMETGSPPDELYKKP